MSSSLELSGPALAPANGAPAKKLVILLHGYGSDGQDLIGLGQYWANAFPHVGFYSPNAPHRCGMNPMGYEWFPLNVERIGADYTRGAESAWSAAGCGQVGLRYSGCGPWLCLCLLLRKEAPGSDEYSQTMPNSCPYVITTWPGQLAAKPSA